MLVPILAVLLFGFLCRYKDKLSSDNIAAQIAGDWRLNQIKPQIANEEGSQKVVGFPEALIVPGEQVKTFKQHALECDQCTYVDFWKVHHLNQCIDAQNNEIGKVNTEIVKQRDNMMLMLSICIIIMLMFYATNSYFGLTPIMIWRKAKNLFNGGVQLEEEVESNEMDESRLHFDKMQSFLDNIIGALPSDERNDLPYGVGLRYALMVEHWNCQPDKDEIVSGAPFAELDNDQDSDSESFSTCYEYIQHDNSLPDVQEAVYQFNSDVGAAKVSDRESEQILIDLENLNEFMSSLTLNDDSDTFDVKTNKKLDKEERPSKTEQQIDKNIFFLIKKKSIFKAPIAQSSQIDSNLVAEDRSLERLTTEQLNETTAALIDEQPKTNISNGNQTNLKEKQMSQNMQMYLSDDEVTMTAHQQTNDNVSNLVNNLDKGGNISKVCNLESMEMIMNVSQGSTGTGDANDSSLKSVAKPLPKKMRTKKSNYITGTFVKTNDPNITGISNVANIKHRTAELILYDPYGERIVLNCAVLQEKQSDES